MTVASNEGVAARVGTDGGASAPWRRRLRGLLLTAAAILACRSVTACASSDARAVAAPSVGEVVVAAAPPPPSVAYDMPASEALAPTPSPERRPGLGTEWGEERVSPIEDVSFRRDDETRPLASTELRYDDERGVMGLAAHVAQRGQRGHEASAAGGAISIWLKDGSDRPLDVVQVGGETFVVGEAGDRYTIVLQNHTGHRFETVATVDGLDVINGKPGTVGNRGYLLMPYATLEIDGFRRSEQTVAAFRFGRVGDSYAAKVGTARDVGVIGMAFFGERGDRWSAAGYGADDEVRRRATANPFPADGRFAPPPRW